MAAWRDEAGRACLEVLEAGPGTDWLPGEARDVQAEHRGALSYDAIGANLEAADRMTRPPYRVRAVPLRMRDQVGAAARIEREIVRRNVQHYGDAALTGAVETASWRPAGNAARLFLRTPGVCVLVAAAEALWAYDARARSGGRRRIVSSAALATRQRGRDRSAA